MELSKKIYHAIIIFLEEILSTTALIICVSAIIIQVFYRYFLNISLEWPFEVSIYAYIWTLYLGAAWGIREGHHVKFNLLFDVLPTRIQKMINIIFNSITTTVFIIIFKPVWGYLWFNYRIKTVALKIPWTYVFGVFSIFLFLTIIHNIEYIIYDIKFLFTHKDFNKQEIM
ncbi:MAG: TRAP transporter small permease subunit [Atribacterota bacterium]|nr:TRAP transporter small permease subunit [Atribacterota bacterium]MDD5497187.1 TRAP transporter small permease subunit [Atribacterota bacterium]